MPNCSMADLRNLEQSKKTSITLRTIVRNNYELPSTSYQVIQGGWVYVLVMTGNGSTQIALPYYCCLLNKQRGITFIQNK